jgi:hypothetical protein
MISLYAEISAAAISNTGLGIEKNRIIKLIYNL